MELDRKDLKIQALLQKINEYEDKIADLRVDVTIAIQQIEDKDNTIETQQNLINQLSSSEVEDVQASSDTESSD